MLMKSMKKTVLLALLGVVCLPLATSAQTTKIKLGLLIPNLYGPGGLKVDSEARLPDGSTHSAHFNSSFESEFSQFNVALATQLLTVPFPSPASGYTYRFDESLGVFTRSTQSFGPILTDRAETIGKGKFTFGFAFQRFRFDSVEGIPLDSVPAVFTHDDAQLGGGRSDIVVTQNDIRADVNRFVAFFTYGLAGGLDVSLALPIVDASLSVTSDARVARVGTGSNLAVHFFRDAQGGFGDTRRFEASGSASGIGDVILRLKGTPPRNGPTSLAFMTDVRFPTGDEQDLLGSGAWGVRPALVLSWGLGHFSPHLNLGYQWNGKSLLAGDITTNRKEDLPNQFFFAGGLDVGVTKHLTLALDVLGQRVVDAPRLVKQTFTAANGQTFDQVGFERGSFNVTDASVGVKVSAGGSLLLDVNLLFKLDSAGLRAKFSPLVALEYSF
jgi:hypothetical protein